MTDDPRSWMWSEACVLLERAERMRARFFEPDLSGRAGAAWEAPVDLFETEREIWIIVALPGVAPGDMEVLLQSDTLVVTGRRPMPAAMRKAVIHRLEIPHGRFERRIRLPAARLRLGAKELANGCLVLSLEKLS
jgi:HSP20 family molecular chaperone IbpA